MTQTNWSRGKIRYHLENKGYAELREVDRKFGLTIGTTSDAIRYPSGAGEPVIAKIIGVPAAEIWPDRYDAEGVRLKPQPASLYTAKRVVGQCQKSVAA